MDQHLKYMQRAIELAQKGKGYVSPNPLVGAVIVKNGRVIGEGYHERYGGPHAEINAIANSNESVEGATMYCTLEPCCHSTKTKKTPPCTSALLKEKIGRLIVAMPDPNPHVSGKGLTILEENGIEVEFGLLQSEAMAINEAYIHSIQHKTPFVLLKMAMSLDGRIATKTGHSKWITDQSARKIVHQIRAEYDAILVGSNTVIEDNPALTVRLVKGRQPFRIVLDSQLKSPLNSQLYSDLYRDKTIIFTTLSSNSMRFKEFQANGLNVQESMPVAGRVNISEVLSYLFDHKISSVMVEGGSHVHTSFIKEGLFNKINCFIAPIIIGNGLNAIGELGTTHIHKSLKLQKTTYKQIGKQLLVTGYHNNSEIVNQQEKEKECLQES